MSQLKFADRMDVSRIRKKERRIKRDRKGGKEVTLMQIIEKRGEGGHKGKSI